MLALVNPQGYSKHGSEPVANFRTSLMRQFSVKTIHATKIG
jgi:hypothetical protein